MIYVWIGLATLNGLGAGDKNICNNLHISTHDLKQLVSRAFFKDFPVGGHFLKRDPSVR